MENAILKTFTNTEDGLEATVRVADSGGFGVTLKDLDSGEFVPVVHFYLDFDDACFSARCAAGLARPAGVISVAVV